MKIRKLETLEEIKSALPILLELRPHLTLETFLNIYDMAQKRDEYELVAAFQDQQLVGLMGFRILYDYVHGKHLYIDDLIVTESKRNLKIGAQLLKYAEEQARVHQCLKLRLCTGIDNQKGKKFYDREGWKLRAVVYKK